MRCFLWLPSEVVVERRFILNNLLLFPFPSAMVSEKGGGSLLYITYHTYIHTYIHEIHAYVQLIPVARWSTRNFNPPREDKK